MPAAHAFSPDPDGDCTRCPLPADHPTHDVAPLPDLPYGMTSGWSGSETSMERAMGDDLDGTTTERQATALTRLAHAGALGLTWKELADLTGWHHGQASGTLSVLHKEGRIARLTERRDRCAEYVLPQHVGGRETAKHGRKRTALLVEQIEAACAEAEDDMTEGSDHYHDLVVPVSVLRGILNGDDD